MGRRLQYLIGALLAVLWGAPLGAQQTTGTIVGHVTDGATQQGLSGVTCLIEPVRLPARCWPYATTTISDRLSAWEVIGTSTVTVWPAWTVTLCVASA